MLRLFSGSECGSGRPPPPDLTKAVGRETMPIVGPVGVGGVWVSPATPRPRLRRVASPLRPCSAPRAHARVGARHAHAGIAASEPGLPRNFGFGIVCSIGGARPPSGARAEMEARVKTMPMLGGDRALRLVVFSGMSIRALCFGSFREARGPQHRVPRQISRTRDTHRRPNSSLGRRVLWAKSSGRPSFAGVRAASRPAVDLRRVKCAHEVVPQR